jgi:hypothetical protein
MMNAPVNRRLRLAARTLVEWRTPSGNPDYKGVFADLARAHTGAAQYGLAENQDVLRLDDEGSLLWFMSETLQDHQKDQWPSLRLVRGAEKELVDRCLTTLTSGQNSWNFAPDVLSGYRSEDLRDIILAAMKGEKLDNLQKSILALVILSLPIPQQLQAPYVQMVTSRVAVITFRLRQAAMMARRLYTSIVEGVDVMRLLSSLGFVIGIMFAVGSFVFGSSLTSISSSLSFVLGVIAVLTQAVKSLMSKKAKQM